MTAEYVFDRVSVAVLVRQDDLLLVSCSLCSDFTVHYEADCESAPKDASPSLLGVNAQRAMLRCRVGVSGHVSGGDDLVHRVGARSWTDLNKRMWRASLGRSARETSVNVRNTIPKGRNGAFGSFHRVVDLHDTQALGQALWEALRTTT